MPPLTIATALALIVLDSAAATSHSPAAGVSKATAKAASNDADRPDRVICKSQPMAGTRFMTRVCATRAQRDEQQRRTDEFERRLGQTSGMAASAGSMMRSN